MRTRTEMVFETLVSKKLNHLTRLIAQENFIICNFCLCSHLASLKKLTIFFWWLKFFKYDNVKASVQVIQPRFLYEKSNS
jgi:hypothetical protein